jgi:Acetamidase/Formamidase family
MRYRLRCKAGCAVLIGATLRFTVVGAPSFRCDFAPRVDQTAQGVPCPNMSALSAVKSPTAAPGGHILTGPVYVNGAMPGDALELRILEIDFAVP